MMEFDEDIELDKFVSVLGNTMQYVANETVLLAQLEQYFDPKPASIAENDEEIKILQKRVEKLVEDLGGPPKLIIVKEDDPKPRYDLYPAAALQEVISMFHRTRKATLRAHMFMIGSQMVRNKPEFLTLPDNKEAQEHILKSAEATFWEHAETAFIRLASFWDRVGQLLDFAFFRIRQFERDGFSSVVDRIRNNVALVHSELATNPSWERIRSYQTSEKADGLKWLLRRRNLLVHSLYLRPFEKADDDAIFDSEFNHLDASLREKLAPGNIEEELTKIHIHLSKAAQLFPDILSLCETSMAMGANS
ncbi:MAG: hypothetical protein EG828_05475 [Deltaproteobacteria bacterium]|nr:hypothetical protein [Deltaproteobacteria bacterium]